MPNLWNKTEQLMRKCRNRHQPNSGRHIDCITGGHKVLPDRRHGCYVLPGDFFDK